MEAVLYFVVGTVAGAVLVPKVRPLLLGAATAGYKLADAVSSKTSAQRKGVEGFFSSQRKSIEEFFAEARTRARAPAAAQPPARA